MYTYSTYQNKDVYMKRIIMVLVLFMSILFVYGCCSNDMCDIGSSFKSCNNCTKSCSTCNACTSCSTCNTCGYDASYTYSSWY